MKYVNNSTKVTLICKKCGKVFDIDPTYFWKYGGCECQRDYKKVSKLTIDTFIQRAEEKWGDICDYSGTIYTGANNEVEVYCKEHQGYFR